MLKNKIIIFVLMLFAFCNYVFADLQVRSDITDTTSYFKTLIVNDSGIFGSTGISIDSIDGNIQLTGQLNVSNQFCLRGACKSSFDSIWSQSGTSLSFLGGKIGIGTTNPAYTLDINGTLNTSRVRVGELFLSGSLYRSLTGNNEFLSQTNTSVFRKGDGKAILTINESGITVGDSFNQGFIKTRGKLAGLSDPNNLYFGDENNAYRFNFGTQGSVLDLNAPFIGTYYSTGSGESWNKFIGVVPTSLISQDYSFYLKDNLFVISTGNNLGIGILNPSYKLDVDGVIDSSRVRIGEEFDGGSLFRGTVGNSEYISTSGIHNFKSFTGELLAILNDNGLQIGDKTVGKQLSIQGKRLSTYDSALLYFGDETNSQRYFVGMKGSLEDPAASFDLTYYINGTGETWVSPIGIYPDALNSPNYSLGLGENNLVVDSDNHIGIHTFSAYGDLHILNPNYNAEIDIQSVPGDGNHWGIYHDKATAELRFSNQRDDKMVISTTGRLGIGLTQPQTRLDLLGNMLLRGENRFQTGGDISKMYFGDIRKRIEGNYGGSTIFTSNSKIRINSENQVKLMSNGNDNQVFLATNGNVGIGTSDPVTKLQVAGEIRVTSCVQNTAGTAIAGTCSSDERLKKDILSITGVLDSFTTLQPVTYKRKNVPEFDGYFGSGISYGLIAQDAQNVLPDLVTTDEKGFKKVDYGVRMTMYMIQSIKELKYENDKLYNEILSYKSQIGK